MRPTLLGFGFIQVFIFILMTLVGVPTLEAARVLAVLLAQTIPGLIIWIALDSKNLSSPTLTIGAGTTIGICFSTLSQILIGSDRIWGIGWLAPFVFAIPLLLVIKKRFANELETSANIDAENIKEWLPVIVLASLIGLKEQWWWSLPIVIVVGIYVVLLLKSKTSQLWNWAFIAALPITYLSSIHMRQWNTKWWVYSNDIAWNTTLSFSINQWGRNENIGAVGQVVRYHWFALKWAGMTSELADAGTWTLITFVLPIVACITIALLIWGITYEQTGSKVASALAAILVLLIRDVVSASSPTHLFAYMPMLTIIVLMGQFIKSRSIPFNKLAVTILIIFALFGSKLSTAAVTVGAVFLFLILDSGIDRARRILFAFLIATATAGSYFYFFSGDTGTAIIDFRFTDAGGRLIFDRPIGGGVFHLALEMLLMLLYLAPYLGGIIIAVSARSYFKNSTTKFLILFIISAFALARFIDGQGTESYFLHSTFPVLALLFVVEITNHFKTNNKLPSGSAIVTIFLLGVIAGLARHWLTRTKNAPGIKYIPEPLVPYFLMYVVIAASLFWIYLKTNGKTGRAVALAISLSVMLTSTMLGEQIHRRYSFAKYAATGIPNPQMIKTNYITGSTDQIAALKWLREETPINDVVATNRFCLSPTSCATPKWSLVSALGHRRMLIEAPMHFSTSGLWVGERMDYSQQFVVTPSAEYAATLWNLGVRWQYIDLDFIALPSGWEPLEVAQKRSWEPWAETVVKNDTVAILRIKDPAGN